ncbi:translation elongation factor Ts [Roseofilum sp. BLCC_M91]|uniref:Elongation factor Ts n=1 Tax=Roseofilum halophilum BLCC-M91 TaxID=3022259 RepID=A0ABT7BK86_9CYAN|nr:translation elongation factor Ts [Roseofilum halophilum]MDJ1178999.1 translation elongation factor Ts [Roseofilum halophilum BLCC-M91]
MAEISAKLVKELREKTGAGMMDCKKALQETDGDLEKASEWLRKKGIASAGKKSSRVAAEGLIDSYIHTGSRIGVLVEVNCETDFVARGEAFQTLVRDIAMQIAAYPNVEYVSIEDIPAEIVEKEKSIEMGREDLAKKPDNIKEKIVAGRIEKRLKELTLLDQSYIKDQTKTVGELVTETIASLGENIQVRRFARFVLGEGIEKEESNFAEEVAAQVSGK